MVHLVNTPASLQTTTAMRKQLQLIYTAPIKNEVLSVFWTLEIYITLIIWLDFIVSYFDKLKCAQLLLFNIQDA